MDLFLNNILNLTQQEIENSKIQFNMQEGSGGEFFLEKWLRFTEEEKMSGECKECSFWGWRNATTRNFYPGQWCFSFVRMNNDDWLFVSAAEIVEVPANTWAKVKILKRFVPLFGRMIIKCKKGNTFGSYTFNLNTYLDKSMVKEILPCLYNGETFEGYDKVNLPFHRLSDVFAGRIMPTYYEALRKVTGVYCLTDTSNGKLYIGSATGGEGVAQRWGNYLDSKHGGNVELIKVFKDKGSEHFEKYFMFTLLEYFGLSYDPNKIKEREQYWKVCLHTKTPFGYNDN